MVPTGARFNSTPAVLLVYQPLALTKQSGLTGAQSHAAHGPSAFPPRSLTVQPVVVGSNRRRLLPAAGASSVTSSTIDILDAIDPAANDDRTILE